MTRTIPLLERASAPEGPISSELTMVEMTPSAELLASEDAAIEPEQVLPPELMTALTEAVDTEPEFTEVPDTPTLEDLVTIPEAPSMEAMLTPAQPRKPATAPPVARSQSVPSRSTSPRTSASATSGGGGGTGGSGSSASGNTKGYFPAPPYPAAARSRGMQGTVYLSITFGADGRVTAASVSRSSGYSDLDRAASDWVRRNWRAASGQNGTFRQPVQFRLR